MAAVARPSVRAWVAHMAQIVRRIIGAPDYDAYLRHVCECRPDVTPMTHEDFVREAMTRTYSQPGNRCC